MSNCRRLGKPLALPNLYFSLMDETEQYDKKLAAGLKYFSIVLRCVNQGAKSGGKAQGKAFPQGFYVSPIAKREVGGGHKM